MTDPTPVTEDGEVIGLSPNAPDNQPFEIVPPPPPILTPPVFSGPVDEDDG